MTFLVAVFAQIAFSLNAYYDKNKVFIFSHTSHVLATFAKTSDGIVNNIRLFCKMRATTTYISSYLSSHYYSFSTKTTPIKAIVISLLSVIWAFLLINPTNAEASNSDNHSSRSRIFEEKGN